MLHHGPQIAGLFDDIDRAVGRHVNLAEVIRDGGDARAALVLQPARRGPPGRIIP